VAAEAVERFAADLGALVPSNMRLGVAVSGGPDSLALLLLALAAVLGPQLWRLRPGVVAVGEK